MIYIENTMVWTAKSEIYLGNMGLSFLARLNVLPRLSWRKGCEISRSPGAKSQLSEFFRHFEPPRPHQHRIRTRLSLSLLHGFITTARNLEGHKRRGWIRMNRQHNVETLPRIAKPGAAAGPRGCTRLFTIEKNPKIC
jgi:hypothetical protein